MREDIRYGFYILGFCIIGGAVILSITIGGLSLINAMPGTIELYSQ